MTSHYLYLLGAATFGAWAAGIYFFKFWRQTRDRFFLFFGAAFWLMALERLVLWVLAQPSHEDPFLVYLIRLAAFLLILFAIVEKNREDKRQAP